MNMMINGRAHTAKAEPRTHLADFLRDDMLLTGTHLGCEHGVCGACTVLVDDQPVRSCLTFAAQCEGASVCSIEGLAEDGVMVALRAAFTAEHALQCGYCTPGMLITARDIVLRLPQADDDRVRLELSGNLCRCTGYNGIVKAIRRVLDAQIAAPLAPIAPVPEAAPIVTQAADSVPITLPPNAATLSQTLRITQPLPVVWAAIQDPAFVASCVPGAVLTQVEGEHIAGELRTSLGPIQARFTGTATLAFTATSHSGHLIGEGRDAFTGTRLAAEARFAVLADGEAATLIQLNISYALRGALAQFSRGPIVQVFAAEIAATVATNLDAKLRGVEPPAKLPLLRMLWRALKRLLNIAHE